MNLSPIDMTIVIGYILFALGLGIYYSKRAGSNINEFFISGRNLPWWLAGTSMVATTFAADTPLAITGLVVEGGIAGNWLWWNGVLGGMLATFLFSRLWRRAEILTDVELTELRYGRQISQHLAWISRTLHRSAAKLYYHGMGNSCHAESGSSDFQLAGYNLLENYCCSHLHGYCWYLLRDVRLLGSCDD